MRFGKICRRNSDEGRRTTSDRVAKFFLSRCMYRQHPSNVLSNVADAIVEGLSERKAGKEKSAEGKKDKAAKPAKAKAKAVANDEEE